MPIPESQLRIWAKKHTTNKAQWTHEKIREAIGNYNYSREYNFITYLQGSYRNGTNIWADTDVDIIVQLNSIDSVPVFIGNSERLSHSQKALLNLHYRRSSYSSLENFKSEVIDALRSRFGIGRVKKGRKSIKVLADRNRTMYDADVVVCLQYRLYVRSKARNTTRDSRTGLYYYEGIWFRTSDGKSIVNFPTLHYKNGVEKHERTGNRFKKVVRIFKNMRNLACEMGLITKEVAPSYFIQCLLYNAPDELYRYSLFEFIVYEILDWSSKVLQNPVEAGKLISQNELIPLFGTGNDKWNIQNARKFISSLIYLWNNWGS